MATTSESIYFEAVPPLSTDHKIYFEDARKVTKLHSNSVHLVVTSPPYWSIKDYSGDKRQIGFNDSLDTYLEKLLKVFQGCVRALNPGCRLCINIGDQFLKATKTTPYQIIPIHARLVNMIALDIPDLTYVGSINWHKVTTSNTSGGGKVMGSVYYPRNPYFFVNHEYIAVFRKRGKDPRPPKEYKEASRFSLEDRREWVRDTWSFPGERQKSHIAMFPEELPKRLIKLHSFVGDTVLDPFVGSGTTSKVAAQLGRSSVGFEIGFEVDDGDWREVLKEKVRSSAEMLDPTIPFLTAPTYEFFNRI